MKTQEAVGIRIKELCSERNLTINGIANLSAVPPMTVYSMYYGKSKNPGIVNIKKLCDDAMPEKNPKNFSTSGKEARCLEMIEYFLMHYPVQECYFDNKYYDTILSTDTSQYTLGDVLGIQALNRNVIISREDDERFQFYQDVFEEQFTASKPSPSWTAIARSIKSST